MILYAPYLIIYYYCIIYYCNSYRTRIIVTGFCWNTCKLVFTITRIHGYPDSYSCQYERDLRLVAD